jgi:hypothetical protein
MAQTNIAFPFDTASEVSLWSHWWGGPPTTIEFDPAVDAASDPNSGSMKITVNFDVTKYGGDNQFSILCNLAQSVDGSKYSDLVMDVFIDPNSPQRPSGDYGALDLGTRYDDWSQNYFGNTNLSTLAAWLHLDAPVPFGDSSTSSVAGLTFKMWSGDSGWGQSGTYTFWVDNVRLVPKPTATNIVDTFDNASDVSQWSHWWGAAVWALEFDPSVDADGDPESGSMKVTIDFDLAAHTGDNQFCFLRNIGNTIDGTLYTNMTMDVLVDPTSQQSGGNFGNWEFGPRHGDWSSLNWGAMSLPNTGGWIHLDGPVALTDSMVDSIAGMFFKMWSGASPGGFTGRSVFWVDNVQLVAKNPNQPPVAPPTLALRPTGGAGLRLFASTGNQYQRQNIRTVNPAYSWLTALDPVTFSVTIADYPDMTKNGFQTHIFLLPAPTAVAATDSSPDWDQPNTIFVQIANNADGSANMRFMYKTNQPSANSMFWNDNPASGPVGTLASLWNPTPKGTWSVSFKAADDGSALIGFVAPNGGTTNFTMSAESAALFANPLYAYFGVQPNSAANCGQAATFSRIQISGDPGSITPIDETFSGDVLDTTIWEKAAEDATGLVLVSDAAAGWLSWTLPDKGFQVQWSPTLSSGSWVVPDPALPAAFLNNGVKTILVPKEGLPQPNCFFRLSK